MYLRPTWLEIDTGAIRHNVQQVKQLIGQDQQIMAVVKADGYGHDAVAVSQACLAEGVSWLAVSMISEAMALRAHDIDCPILILGWTPLNGYEIAIRENIRLAIFNLHEARELSQIAQTMNTKARIHIKLDTGMSRLGILPDLQGLDIVKAIIGLPGLEVEGIFSHFSKADEKDKKYAQRQLSIFNDFIHMIEDSTGYHIPLKHIANSAGIIDLADSHWDMVRAGIMLYGMMPSEEMTNQVDLRPALTWKAQIARIEWLPAGTLIGYGGTYCSAQAIKVATIPVGYADGYNRLLSNKGSVLFQGKKLPVVGRICMDQFMIDATEFDNIAVGDEVTLLGQSGDQSITANDWAKLLDTISYEIFCRISLRVPKIFL